MHYYSTISWSDFTFQYVMDIRKGEVQKIPFKYLRTRQDQTNKNQVYKDESQMLKDIHKKGINIQLPNNSLFVA